MGTSNFIFFTYVIIGILIIAIVLLAGIAFFIKYKEKKEQQDKNSSDEVGKNGTKDKTPGKGSVYDFLEFEDVVDNMIVRKNRTQYVMVIQCKGINYDLLSEEEKNAVESGFVQFLNTLRFPIQLYVQTRSLNLRDTIEEYKSRVGSIQTEIAQIDVKIKKAKMSGNQAAVQKLEFEKRRKNNVLEYGNDIADYVEKMSSNQNVLKQNTYIVVSYYTAEFGGEISNYSKDEIDNISFSELYTRAQTIIRSLASAEVYGRVLDSEELAELLYVAYNRDQEEVLNLRKSLDAEYDSFYVTAPHILDKKMKKIEKEVEEEAIALATASILEADKIKMLERNKKRRVKERAKELVNEYKDSMNEELYKETMNQIDRDKERSSINKSPKTKKRIIS